jgi:bloom syndrome protein
MQDQVAGLQARGIAADYLASTRTEAERRALLARLDALAGTGADGAAPGGAPSLSLLYVTPELLQTDAFRARLVALHGGGGGGGTRSPIKLVAIDEAHCISEYVRGASGGARGCGVARSLARWRREGCSAATVPR